MKIQPLVIAATLTLLFTGCSGTDPTRLIGNTIGVAGGTLLGSTLGKRNLPAMAAGAGAGLLLSESLHDASTHAAEKSYAAGYEEDEAIPPSSNTIRSSSNSGMASTVSAQTPSSSSPRYAFLAHAVNELERTELDGVESELLIRGEDEWAVRVHGEAQNNEVLIPRTLISATAPWRERDDAKRGFYMSRAKQTASPCIPQAAN